MFLFLLIPGELEKEFPVWFYRLNDALQAGKNISRIRALVTIILFKLSGQDGIQNIHYFCITLSGVPYYRAEIIPYEPDADNADVGSSS